MTPDSKTFLFVIPSYSNLNCDENYSERLNTQVRKKAMQAAL